MLKGFPRPPHILALFTHQGFLYVWLGRTQCAPVEPLSQNTPDRGCHMLICFATSDKSQSYNAAPRTPCEEYSLTEKVQVKQYHAC